MARIRTIKPEFWTSEQVMECSLNARLMFIGMWNFADDLGRLPLSPKTIKAMIFPSDDISPETVLGLIQELSTNGLVLPYAVDGKEYLQITGWQHQRIDKPQPSKYPAPVNGYSKNVPGMVATERKGKEGKVEERKDDDAGDARARSLISREAQELADELLVIAGHKLEFIPPGWCGAAMRVQAWLAEWPREVILIAVKSAAARKRGPPAATVDYFQNAVAEEFARQSAPLPKVEIRESEKLTVIHGKSQARSGSLIASLDRAIAAAELAENADPSLPADSVLRIPDRSVC